MGSLKLTLDSFFKTEWKEEVAVDQGGVRGCVWRDYDENALFEIFQALIKTYVSFFFLSLQSVNQDSWHRAPKSPLTHCV